jgi:RNA polymerase sigma factor (sigma-70 family)
MTTLTIKELKRMVYVYVKHSHRVFLESLLYGDYFEQETPSLSLITNEEAIDKIKNLESDFFKVEIYKELFGRIKASIIKMGGNEEDARDVLQNVLLDMMEKALRGELVIEPSKRSKKKYMTLSYTYQDYIVGACINQYKKKISYFNKHSDEKYDELEDDTKEYIDDYDYVQGLLNKGSEICKKILISYYFEKKKFTQIAKEIGNTPGSVKNQKSRCIKNIRFFRDTINNNI